ncbi:hypothetical protein [Ruminiclostridium josui]|uniref:hypothetical protein n=1 Tax=Ruminiclostridium josui TaxID=1499 RepID=UPI0004647834|nr:hypothetical protein [Ruminiclostridium josui]
MPNHVTNRLTIIAEINRVSEIKNFIQIEKSENNEEVYGPGTIDLNKITPMPRWVYGSNPKVFGISRADEEKYGEDNTSLGWARKNWGTKWNAYGQPDKRNSDNVIFFQTAWNCPHELVKKLS